MAWLTRSQFVDIRYQESYGATECGAIAENGRLMSADSGREVEGKLLQLGPRAEEAGYPLHY